jgi:hypothetical protein
VDDEAALASDGDRRLRDGAGALIAAESCGLLRATAFSDVELELEAAERTARLRQ